VSHVKKKAKGKTPRSTRFFHPAQSLEDDALRPAPRGSPRAPFRAWRRNRRVHGARAQDVAGWRGRLLGQLRQGHRHGHECAARQCQRHPHLTDGRLDRRADAARVARGRSSRARRGHRAGHGRRCRRCARTRRGRGAGLLVGDDQARAGLRPALQYAPCSEHPAPCSMCSAVCASGVCTLLPCALLLAPAHQRRPRARRPSSSGTRRASCSWSRATPRRCPCRTPRSTP